MRLYCDLGFIVMISAMYSAPGHVEKDPEINRKLV
jgi:hypothetical protein